MNDYARERMRMRREMRDGRGGMRRGMRDGTHGEYRGGMDWRGNYAMRDGRQGVKGTGRYGRGGSMYRDRDYEDDYGYDEAYDMGYDDDYGYDYNYDYAMRDGRGRGRRGGIDYADEDMHLSKQEIMEWKRSMENADGTKGEHYRLEEIMPVAEKMGVKFEEFDEKEFCLAVNMMYSDYCRAMKESVALPPDKELMTYIKLAKAWLEDEDAPEGSEKLALYYRCVICD